MFDKILQELKQIENMKITIPIKSDADGYLDKECPAGDCLFHFKVYADDWSKKFSNEAVYCPLCGNNAPAESYCTAQQREEGTKQAINYYYSRVSQVFSDNINGAQSGNDFIKLRMEYQSNVNLNYYILPIEAEKELRQKVTCTRCSARYSVLGSAFFCPCCGYNSVTEMFDNSLKKIQTKLRNLEPIRSAVSEISEDEAEITVRSLIESTLSDGIVAFQRFCELTYRNQTNDEIKIKSNAFQSLEIGGEYWEKLYGQTYKDWITMEEYNRLNILLQRRHLLAHCEGIVDDKYIQKSRDNSYKFGQRIVVNKKDVFELVEIITRITNKIKELSQ